MNNYTKKTKMIEDVSTPYYSGSAMFLAIYPIFKEISKIEDTPVYDYMDALKNATSSLFDQDARLFSLSKLEVFSDKDERDLTTIFQSYSEFITLTRSVIEFLIDRQMISLAKHVDSNLRFAKAILKDSYCRIFRAEEQREEIDPLRKIDGTLVDEYTMPTPDSPEDCTPACYYEPLVASTHPIVALLNKLVHRKNMSKKPFSEEYRYGEKLPLIESYDEIDPRNKEEISERLKALAKIADEAVPEIKNDSLKADYRWIRNQLNQIADMIDTIKL